MTSKKAHAALRDAAMGYPDTIEDHPWGECAFKVNRKVFLFLCASDAKELSLSCKLPKSGRRMLREHTRFAKPTGYGLGKSGWVSARFAAGDDVPIELLTEWIDESFRAIAPKKLVSALDDLEAEEELSPPIRSKRLKSARPALGPARAKKK